MWRQPLSTFRLLISPFYALTHSTECNPESVIFANMSIYKQYARPVWPPNQRSEALSACLQDTVKKIHAAFPTSYQKSNLGQARIVQSIFSSAFLPTRISASTAFRRPSVRCVYRFIPTMARMSPPTFRLSHSPSAAVGGGETRRAAPRVRRSRSHPPSERSSLFFTVEVNYEFGNRKYDMKRIQMIWVGMQWTKTYIFFR